MSSEAKEKANSEEMKNAGAQGRLVVVSSPSGGGKGTLIRRALKIVPELGYSVSFTTRSPRVGEIEGHHYFFVSVEKFNSMIERGEFLEWAVVHGNFYGTSRTEVERELRTGRDLILEIDVQGASSVRTQVSDAISIFILPPSFEVLRARLTTRASESSDDLALRLKNSKGEVEHYREFQYVVINDDAERAAKQLAAIIHAERARRERQEDAAQSVLLTFRHTE